MMSELKEKLPKLIAVVGPTASGKTSISLELCRAIGGEVVSMDSMQIYEGLKIGTARISPKEARGVSHSMLGIIPPNKPYSVAEYVADALPIIAGILSLSSVPVLVGGTGLYLDGIRYERSFGSAPASPVLREKLEHLTNEELYSALLMLHKEAASRVHPANRRKVIRYIEIITMSGKPPSPNERKPRYDVLPIGIHVPKEILDKRIEERVRAMTDAGLVDEVRSLLASGVSRAAQSMQAIGYKEIIEYLDGNRTLDEAVERIIIGTRQYAKRQMTWFRRTEGIVWFDAEDTAGIIEAAKRFLYSP
jgi:tRNA dimethylallyltransferase